MSLNGVTIPSQTIVKLVFACFNPVRGCWVQILDFKVHLSCIALLQCRFMSVAFVDSSDPGRALTCTKSKVAYVTHNLAFIYCILTNLNGRVKLNHLCLTRRICRPNAELSRFCCNTIKAVMILSFPWPFWSIVVRVVVSPDLVVSLKVVCQGKNAAHSEGRLTRIADAATPCIRIEPLNLKLDALDKHNVD